MEMGQSFWQGINLQNFLFEGFGVESPGGFAGLLIGLLSISILYEGLRQLRDFFINRFTDTRKACLNSGQSVPHDSVQRRKQRGRSKGIRENESASSTKRCDSIRYYNINARNPQQLGGAGDTNEHLVDDHEITERSKWIHHAGAGDQSSPAIIHGGNVRVRIEDLIVATFLHMIYITLGYLLMLAVMTFNTFILVAVCAGIGIGYLVFGTFRRFDHLATYKQITIRECCDPSSASSVGPLIPGSSTSSTDSDRSDTAFTVKEATDPRPTSSRACCGAEDDTAAQEGENRSLVVDAQVH